MRFNLVRSVFHFFLYKYKYVVGILIEILLFFFRKFTSFFYLLFGVGQLIVIFNRTFSWFLYCFSVVVFYIAAVFFFFLFINIYIYVYILAIIFTLCFPFYFFFSALVLNSRFFKRRNSFLKFNFLSTVLGSRMNKAGVVEQALVINNETRFKKDSLFSLAKNSIIAPSDVYLESKDEAVSGERADNNAVIDFYVKEQRVLDRFGRDTRPNSLTGRTKLQYEIEKSSLLEKNRGSSKRWGFINLLYNSAVLAKMYTKFNLISQQDKFGFDQKMRQVQESNSLGKKMLLELFEKPFDGLPGTIEEYSQIVRSEEEQVGDVMKNVLNLRWLLEHLRQIFVDPETEIKINEKYIRKFGRKFRDI